MATIKGDLQYMSLANLVQMVCLDRRQAMLVLKHHTAGEGVIFFLEGQVVHAQTGSLVGEEAVYHLLSWPEGTFEMKDYMTIPNRTVTVPWKYLLMEGMRQIDEQVVGQVIQQIETEQVLSLAEIEQDNSLEHDVILVLSRLEQLQTRLAEKKSQKRPVLALRLLTDIVNEVATFSETLPGEASSPDYLERVLTHTSETYPAARLLRIENSHLSSNIVSQLYNSWSGNPVERRATFGEIGQSTLTILEVYFAYLVSCFRSSQVAGQWRETCEIFLAELRQNIENVEF